VLDQLLHREPWFTEAQPFWQARDAGSLTAYLPASVLTDIFHISRRQVGNDEARRAVARCLDEFGIVAVYRALLDSALALPGSDFEDNLQIACAQWLRWTSSSRATFKISVTRPYPPSSLPAS